MCFWIFNQMKNETLKIFHFNIFFCLKLECVGMCVQFWEAFNAFFMIIFILSNVRELFFSNLIHFYFNFSFSLFVWLFLFSFFFVYKLGIMIFHQFMNEMFLDRKMYQKQIRLTFLRNNEFYAQFYYIFSVHLMMTYFWYKNRKIW